MLRIPTDAEWTESRIATLPHRWGKSLLKQWHKLKDKDYYKANVRLREATALLLSERLPLDASDSVVCDAAHELALRCAGRAEIFHTMAALRAAMERICEGQGIEPPPAKVKDRSALARMSCSLWWRRKLRKRHGRAVEGAAIKLGRINRHADLYVSNEGLRERLQQCERNKASLESTIARNEAGQEFTLAELAAKSTANKSNRRAELMTRIAGFERVAVASMHAGLFMTMTCPSRFHRHSSLHGGKLTIDNASYDPDETPATAQRFLTKAWACIRAERKRRGLGVYGFRIAEPQHDGTPHWHLLLFCEPEHATAIESVVLKHALKDSPDEPGAKAHRCDFKRVDWSKGSAAGYIAKYVSKNIDGAHVGDDLEGRPAIETAKRVEAWATRWSIRQFQQIGGPPVGVWRELRRVAHIPADAPDYVHAAHTAVSKKHSQDEEQSAAAWDEYCEAQGGVFCGRKARIKLLKATPDKLGRYGDEQAPRPIGVFTSAESWTGQDGLEAEPMAVSILWEIRSARQEWEIVQSGRKPELAQAISEGVQPSPPWTSVNNCTDTRENVVQLGRIESCFTHGHSVKHSRLPTHLHTGPLHSLHP
jgi:hypothetical protein